MSGFFFIFLAVDSSVWKVLPNRICVFLFRVVCVIRGGKSLGSRYYFTKRFLLIFFQVDFCLLWNGIASENDCLISFNDFFLLSFFLLSFYLIFKFQYGVKGFSCSVFSFCLRTEKNVITLGCTHFWGCSFFLRKVLPHIQTFRGSDMFLWWSVQSVNVSVCGWISV